MKEHLQFAAPADAAIMEGLSTQVLLAHEPCYGQTFPLLRAQCNWSNSCIKLIQPALGAEVIGKK